VLDTDTYLRTLVNTDCPAGSYKDATSSLCVACSGGKTSSAGATSDAQCFCAAAGVFTNCALNALLVEHVPHSIYVGEAWDGSGTLYDLSGNGRDALLMVEPSPRRHRQG
jgi:hypothetical protein